MSASKPVSGQVDRQGQEGFLEAVRLKASGIQVFIYPMDRWTGILLKISMYNGYNIYIRYVGFERICLFYRQHIFNYRKGFKTRCPPVHLSSHVRYLLNIKISLRRSAL